MNANDKWEKKQCTKNSANAISDILDDQKKTEVKKYSCYLESEIESKPEAHYNYGYDKSNGKSLSPKKKIKRDKRNLSEEKKMMKKKRKKRMRVKARRTIERWKTNEIG